MVVALLPAVRVPCWQPGPLALASTGGGRSRSPRRLLCCVSEAGVSLGFWHPPVCSTSMEHRCAFAQPQTMSFALKWDSRQMKTFFLEWHCCQASRNSGLGFFTVPTACPPNFIHQRNSACLSADPSPGLKETKDGPRMLLLNISEHSWCQMQLHCRRVAALGSIEAWHSEGNPPQLAHGVRFLCSGLSPGSEALREAAKPLPQPWIRRRGGAAQRERSASATTYCAQLP
jgi:hypothetical protein